jgi:eukaryotic-like serine/threonine-protein kinase
MAEVYRARDSRLGREIALKVVNEVLSGDAELVRRFEQEARLAGSLNHPNLVSVYDFGEHEGTPYFVTELLDGESLRHRLARGRPSLGTALDWASQMAAGLAAAHTRGVIHRDVKPDNVFVTADGKVKLLDFGIAKLTTGVAVPVGHHDLMEDTATPTGGATATGAVLGTPGYMSPEQVRGEPLDARADIFSLGAVLYEMLSGHRAFPGATPVESGYGILHADPEPLPPEVPPPVVQLVQHCLQKDPARRFQSASDLAFALDVLRAPTPSTAGPPLRPRSRRWQGRWTLIAFALGVLAAAVALRLPPPVKVDRSVLPEAEPVTFRWGTVNTARFLPDGRVAFSASFEGSPEEVFVRPSGSVAAQALGMQDTRLLAASRSGELGVLLHPRFGGGWLPLGTLARVPSVGGIPREVAERSTLADWSPSGELALVRGEGTEELIDFPPGRTLFRTSGWVSQLRFSRGGDRLAFLHHPVKTDDMGEVAVLDFAGQVRTLTKRWPTTGGLAWSPEGTEVWFTGGTLQRDTLRAAGLDGLVREVYRGMGEILLEDVAPDGRVLIKNVLRRIEVVHCPAGTERERVLSWGDFNVSLAALSTERKLLFSTFQPTQAVEGLQQPSVVLRGTDGGPAQVLGDGYAMDLSLDGRWALVVSPDAKSLSALPTGAGRPRQIPTRGMELAAGGARWAPDGGSVVAAARTSEREPFMLYRFALDDSPPSRLSEIPVTGYPFLHVSADGRWAAALGTNLQTMLFSLRDGSARPVELGREGLMVPQGFSREGHLWLTLGGRGLRPRTPLLRIDSRTFKVLEERSIGPSDPAGAATLGAVAVSADGRDVAFNFTRTLSRLYILNGLGR